MILMQTEARPKADQSEAAKIAEPVHDRTVMRTIPGYGEALTKYEAAARLGVSWRAIEHWTYDGLRGKVLTRLQIGSRFFYRPADLDEFAQLVTLPGKLVERPVEDLSRNAKAAMERLRLKGFRFKEKS